MEKVSWEFPGQLGMTHNESGKKSHTLNGGEENHTEVEKRRRGWVLVNNKIISFYGRINNKIN